MKKKVVRKNTLNIRSSLSSSEIEEKSEKIRKNLFALSLFKEAKLVLFYISLPEEVQTSGMLRDCLRGGRRVAVPTVNCAKRRIVPFEVKDPGFKLVCGPFDIPEPAKDDRYPVCLEEIDLVIVPGVAFDTRGGRVGFGGGFYDRLLNKLSSQARSIALAFECQIIDRVPREKHDILVDYIVTEKRIICCQTR